VLPVFVKAKSIKTIVFSQSSQSFEGFVNYPNHNWKSDTVTLWLRIDCFLIELASTQPKLDLGQFSLQRE
jgi:hypothetical protein